jgi:hypothetical protein
LYASMQFPSFILGSIATKMISLKYYIWKITITIVDRHTRLNPNKINFHCHLKVVSLSIEIDLSKKTKKKRKHIRPK